MIYVLKALGYTTVFVGYIAVFLLCFVFNVVFYFRVSDFTKSLVDNFFDNYQNAVDGVCSMFKSGSHSV